jgi:uncharacterized membrane protein YfcA
LLTIIFDYGIKTAVATSLTTIVATSAMSSSVYMERNLVNLHLSLIMTPTVVLGALVGVIVNLHSSQKILEIAFSIILFYSAYVMSRGKKGGREIGERQEGEYFFYDTASHRKIYYNIENKHIGSFLGFFAGFVSALLGIGGGVVKTPIVNLVMKVPLRVAMATNLLTISLSTATSATIYLLKGTTDAFLVSTLITGVLVGVYFGTKTMMRLRTKWLRYFFIVLLLLEGVKMLQRGLSG